MKKNRDKVKTTPQTIFEEYKRGAQYKTGMGTRGLYQQNQINERFYVGDQWYGVQCGDTRPLIRYNVIKRIGEYKMAVVTGSNVTARFFAEAVNRTTDIQEHVREYRQAVRTGQSMDVPEEEKITLMMDILGDYWKTTAERVKLDDLKADALRKAYITGTGLIYTYWDEAVETGQYADNGKTSPIVGDIQCEVLDVENVYFGDPTVDDVQSQPYIIIAQRRSVEELQREARRNKRPADVIDAIRPDRDTAYMAGEQDKEEESLQKATVLTKFYRKWNEEGTEYSIHAIRVTEGAVIKPEWDVRVRKYPIAKFSWEKRSNCAYGVSEVTQLVPNQIAINRVVSAGVWGLMMSGMPIMLVNGDVVPMNITNEPGQVVRVYGEMNNAISYVMPRNFNAQFENAASGMIAQTLTQSGANEAALGDIKPDNTSAIIAVREAATMPITVMKNRFYSFIEDVSRIWAEFWVSQYGVRRLKVEDDAGTWYAPFNGEEYRKLLINVRVDVGPANLWSEIQTIQNLDKLLQNQLIEPLEYLERMPKGSVPEQEELVRKVKERLQPTQKSGGGGGTDVAALLRKLPPEYQRKIAEMDPAQREQLLQKMMQGGAM